jgi:hypothetical protein
VYCPFKSFSAMSINRPTCVKCQQEIKNNGCKTPSGDTFHKDCYCCDDCNLTLMGKRVQIIENEHGKFEKRICESCAMKMDSSQLIKKDNLNGMSEGPPPLLVINPNMKCDSCHQMIIGNCSKVNNLYYHEQCFKCDKCNSTLNKNNKYGIMNNSEKWCQSCINKRTIEKGDIKIDDNGYQEKQDNLKKGKIYMSELHKLNASEKGPASLLQSGKNTGNNFVKGGNDRKCLGCGKVIIGPSIKVPNNREYHKNCLDCDECHSKIPDLKQCKIYQDKKLCLKCSSKWTAL